MFTQIQVAALKATDAVAENLVAKKGTPNPFDGVTPSLGPFSDLFKSKIGTVLAIVWFGALAYLGYRLVVTLAALGKSRKGGYGHNMAEQKEEVVWVGAAVVAVVAVPAIYAILVAI